ncbi:MAG: hypothetical protein CFE48_10030 [Pseudomonas sp. PGPPP2]|nr:MAG: hypothetical protein CFE48_10030 [Pseudomonas sp. PGPPP2]
MPRAGLRRGPEAKCRTFSDGLRGFHGGRFAPRRGASPLTTTACNSLTTQLASYEALMNLARKSVGPVSIANSDAAWSAYAHAAIDEAFRAVREVG